MLVEPTQRKQKQFWLVVLVRNCIWGYDLFGIDKFETNYSSCCCQSFKHWSFAFTKVASIFLKSLSVFIKIKMTLYVFKLFSLDTEARVFQCRRRNQEPCCMTAVCRNFRGTLKAQHCICPFLVKCQLETIGFKLLVAACFNFFDTKI